MKIGNFDFSQNKETYIVAELSANHNQDIKIALDTIKAAKEIGCNAVKIQTYTPDTMTFNSNKKYFKISKKNLWGGYNLWSLYKEAHTPYEWHKELFSYAKKIGITIFSTPFDETAVDLLEKLNCPIYKIASFEMTHIPLLKKIAKTKKPIIMSTGMSNLNEIKYSFKTLKKYGAKDITILYCVSNYPSKDEDFNMNNIKELKKIFKCRIGFSDHSLNSEIGFSAILSGAEVVEKHIALKNQKKGHDIKFSLKGGQIKKYILKLADGYKLLGKNKFYRSKSELKSKVFRRSIFSSKKISKGDILSKSNIKIVRPGFGIEPKYYFSLLGKKAPISIDQYEPIKKNWIKKLNLKALI